MGQNQLVGVVITVAATLIDAVVIGLLWLLVVNSPLLAVYPLQGAAILLTVVLCLILSTMMITRRVILIAQCAVARLSAEK